MADTIIVAPALCSVEEDTGEVAAALQLTLAEETAGAKAILGKSGRAIEKTGRDTLLHSIGALTTGAVRAVVLGAGGSISLVLVGGAERVCAAAQQRKK